MDPKELLECLKELVRVDRDWIPKESECSLYVRPTYIGTQVRMYAQSLTILIGGVLLMKWSDVRKHSE